MNRAVTFIRVHWKRIICTAWVCWVTSLLIQIKAETDSCASWDQLSDIESDVDGIGSRLKSIEFDMSSMRSDVRDIESDMSGIKSDVRSIMSELNQQELKRLRGF